MIHPFVEELFKDEEGPPAEAVLSYLIENQVITPEAIRSVHNMLKKAAKQQQKASGERASVVEKIPPPVAPKNDSAEEDAPMKSAISENTPSDSNTAPATNAPVNATTTTDAAPSVRKRHIALRIYYDGGAYNGLAENVGTENDSSVERALFNALQQARFVSAENPRDGYSRCGRTDKGVSAAGQMVALNLKSAFVPEATLTEPSFDDGDNGAPVGAIASEDLPKNSHEKLSVWVPPRSKNGNPAWIKKELSEYDYAKILNNLLPPDIRVLGWAPVSKEFSARFSCTTRVYKYFFVPRQGMNVEAMLQGLNLLVGTHDFRNFCKMDVEKVYNFERKIHSAEIVKVDETTSYILIVGTAFLWHQIRCIASVLFLIGRGLEEPSVVSELLDVERNPGKPGYCLADERPLVLHDCHYESLNIGYSVTNLWNMVCLYEKQWQYFTLAAARVRNCIETLQDLTVATADLDAFSIAKQKQRQKKRDRKINGGTGEQDEYVAMGATTETVTWREAQVLLAACGLIPDPDKTGEAAYTPLLQRARGTSYEEKVAAVQQSSRRRQKYEENVKKRKQPGEDAVFYENMKKQGGSADSN